MRQVLSFFIYLYIYVLICCWHQNPTAQHETTSRRQASMATIRSKSFTFASLAMLSKGPLMSVITKPRTLLRWSDRQTAQISTVWSAMVEKDRAPSGNQETNWFCDVFFQIPQIVFPYAAPEDHSCHARTLSFRPGSSCPVWFPGNSNGLGGIITQSGFLPWFDKLIPIMTPTLLSKKC